MNTMGFLKKHAVELFGAPVVEKSDSLRNFDNRNFSCVESVSNLIIYSALKEKGHSINVVDESLSKSAKEDVNNIMTSFCGKINCDDSDQGEKRIEEEASWESKSTNMKKPYHDTIINFSSKLQDIETRFREQIEVHKALNQAMVNVDMIYADQKSKHAAYTTTTLESKVFGAINKQIYQQEAIMKTIPSCSVYPSNQGILKYMKQSDKPPVLRSTKYRSFPQDSVSSDSKPYIRRILVPISRPDTPNISSEKTCHNTVEVRDTCMEPTSTTTITKLSAGDDTPSNRTSSQIGTTSTTCSAFYTDERLIKEKNVHHSHKKIQGVSHEVMEVQTNNNVDISNSTASHSSKSRNLRDRNSLSPYHKPSVREVLQILEGASNKLAAKRDKIIKGIITELHSNIPHNVEIAGHPQPADLNDVNQCSDTGATTSSYYIKMFSDIFAHSAQERVVYHNMMKDALMSNPEIQRIDRDIYTLKLFLDRIINNIKAIDERNSMVDTRRSLIAKSRQLVQQREYKLGRKLPLKSTPAVVKKTNLTLVSCADGEDSIIEEDSAIVTNSDRYEDIEIEDETYSCDKSTQGHESRRDIAFEDYIEEDSDVAANSSEISRENSIQFSEGSSDDPTHSNFTETIMTISSSASKIETMSDYSQILLNSGDSNIIEALLERDTDLSDEKIPHRSDKKVLKLIRKHSHVHLEAADVNNTTIYKAGVLMDKKLSTGVGASLTDYGTISTSSSYSNNTYTSDYHDQEAHMKTKCRNRNHANEELKVTHLKRRKSLEAFDKLVTMDAIHSEDASLKTDSTIYTPSIESSKNSGWSSEINKKSHSHDTHRIRKKANISRSESICSFSKIPRPKYHYSRKGEEISLKFSCHHIPESLLNRDRLTGSSAGESDIQPFSDNDDTYLEPTEDRTIHTWEKSDLENSGLHEAITLNAKSKVCSGIEAMSLIEEHARRSKKRFIAQMEKLRRSTEAILKDHSSKIYKDQRRRITNAIRGPTLVNKPFSYFHPDPAEIHLVSSSYSSSNSHSMVNRDTLENLPADTDTGSLINYTLASEGGNPISVEAICTKEEKSCSMFSPHYSPESSNAFIGGKEIEVQSNSPDVDVIRPYPLTPLTKPLNNYVLPILHEGATSMEIQRHNLECEFILMDAWKDTMKGLIRGDRNKPQHEGELECSSDVITKSLWAKVESLAAVRFGSTATDDNASVLVNKYFEALETSKLDADKVSNTSTYSNTISDQDVINSSIPLHERDEESITKGSLESDNITNKSVMTMGESTDSDTF